MNLPRIFLIVIVFLAFDFGANGQEPPKAVLVDEYSTTPCDDFLGRLDSFLTELRNNPDSSGLIIIRNSPIGRPRSVVVQSMIDYQLKFRGFNQSRIEIIRPDRDAGPSMQYWRIPDGAAKPTASGVVEGYLMSENVRTPFLLSYETKFGTQICPEIDDQRIFADFLKANSSARGNIVVRDNSTAKARKKATRIQRKFEVNYGISRKRLRTFHTKLQRPSNHDEPIVEYWYLP